MIIDFGAPRRWFCWFAFPNPNQRQRLCGGGAHLKGGCGKVGARWMLVGREVPERRRARQRCCCQLHERRRGPRPEARLCRLCSMSRTLLAALAVFTLTSSAQGGHFLPAQLVLCGQVPRLVHRAANRSIDRLIGSGRKAVAEDWPWPSAHFGLSSAQLRHRSAPAPVPFRLNSCAGSCVPLSFLQDSRSPPWSLSTSLLLPRW